MTQIFPKPRSSVPDRPEVFLAAFGKHPGWNDHIDDLGLETEALVSFKRVLYLDGISGAIESGAWDKLETDRRVDGFGHIIVSNVKGEWLAARLWSSSDGKGRTKYPMVVCAQARGVGLEWVLSRVLPALERVQSRCVEATSAAAVTAVMDTARAELRAALPAGVEAGHAGTPRIVAELADQPALGGGTSGREGLYRLLYQVQRDWTVFTGGAPGGGSRSRVLDARAQHARVPACGATAAESIRRWQGFLRRMASGGATSTVIVPISGPSGMMGWADLIIGDPAGSQYFCLRAAPKAIPPVTEVPYSFDEEFVRGCDERVERSRRGEDDNGGSEAGVQTRGPGLLARLLKSKRLLLVLVTCVVLIGAGAAILMSLRGGDGPAGTGPPAGSTASGESRADEPVRGGAGNGAAAASAAVAPPLRSDDPSVAEWQRLCDEFNDWALTFLQRLDERPRGAAFASRREYYLSDAYLSGALGPLLGAIREGIALDPRSIAGVARDERFAVIRKTPPASAMTSSAKERTAAALRVLDAAVKGLSAWPARSDLEAVEAKLRAAGRTKVADEVQAMVKGATVRGTADLAPGIDRVLAVQGVAASLKGRLEAIESAVAAAGASSDAEISRLPGWVQEQFGAAEPAAGGEGAGGVAALQGMDAAAGRIADVVGPIGEFLGRSGTNIDTTVLGTKRGAGAGSAALTRQSLSAWLADAKASLKLAPELDPRRTWGVEGALAGAIATREKTEKELKVKAEEGSVQRERALGERVESLKRMAWNAGTKAVLEESIPALEAEARALAQRYENVYASEKIRVQGSASEVREQLESQRSIVSRGEAVNSAWRAERDRLLAAYTDAQYPQLAMEAGEARERLIAFDDGVAAGMSLPREGRRWASALSDAGARERDRVMREELDVWGAGGGGAADVDGAKLRRSREEAAAEYAAWVASAERLASDVDRVESMLDRAYGYTEAEASGGQTIGAIVSGWDRSEFVKADGVSGAIAPVLDRARALEQIEQTTDRLRLLSAANSAPAGAPERVVAAWRQLGNVPAPGWPSSASQLDEEQGVEARVAEAIAGIRSAERVKALEDEVAAQRKRRWERCFAAVTEPGEVEAVADRAPAFGVEPSALPDRLRYNLELARLKQVVGQPAMSDAEVVKAAGELAAKARGMEAAVREAPGVAPVLAQLGEIAENTPAPVPRVDLTKLGPGTAGWTGRVAGNVLEFSPTSREARGGTLRFVRVEPAGEPVAYIGVTEVSLGTVIELVEGAGAWSELRTFWREDESDDPRYGPRVWRWSSRNRASAKLRLCERWQQEVFRMRNPPADSPAELGVAAPSLESPMNYLSAGAAAYVAALAGTRLPTTAEWRAAAAAAGEGASASANLRDATWKAQQEYVRATRASAGAAVPPEVQWPDAGIFRGVDAPRGANATARSTRDNVLWFAPGSSEAGAGGAATHLVGNVAEYVIDAAAPAIHGGARPAAATISEYAQQHAARTFVIGGSALSPPEMPADQPLALVEPDELTNGYADVGFRLAFTAAGAAPAPEPLFGRFARVVAEAGYVKP